MTDKIKSIDEAIDSAFEQEGISNNEEDPQEATEVPTESEAKEVETTEDDEVEGATEGVPEEEVSEEVEAQEELPPIQPPQSFRAEAKEAFAQAPRGVQEEISRVMLESQRFITRVSQEAAELRRSTEGINRAFEPYIERIRLSGQAPEQVVSTMLAWDHKFKEDPVNALVEAAQKTGVDLYGFAQQILNGGIQQPDPQYLETQSQLNELRQELSRRQEQEQVLLQQSLESEAESFISETDNKGKLLRPYAQNEDVLQEMVLQIQILKEANPNAAPRVLLQEAYNRAVRLSDTVNSQIQQAEQQKLKQKQQLEGAKKASKSIKQVGSIADKSSKPKTLDESIDSALEKAGLR